MDQAALVGGRQPVGHLAADAQHLGQRQARPSRSQPVLQRLAVEELHGQERHAAVLADLVDGDDVVVLDGGGGPGLAQEALPAAGRSAASDGSITLRATRPAELRVLRLEDHAHAAAAQHGLDAIAAQPAQLPGFLRRSQEIQRQRFTARHTFRGLAFPAPGNPTWWRRP